MEEQDDLINELMDTISIIHDLDKLKLLKRFIESQIENENKRIDLLNKLDV